MAENRLINNMKGILFYLDMPLIDFEIKNRELIKADDLSGNRFYPPELAMYGVTYGNINSFFQRRTMKENSMLYHEHLRAMGLESMDFDRYIMMNNGNNHLDNYWIKFDGFGAKTFRDICNQDYPVC